MNRIHIVALAAVAVAVVAAGCETGGGVAEPLEGEPHAATRRMTVDQLEGTLPVIMGSSTGWRIPDDKNGTLNALDQQVLGATLGRPDYLQVTEEPAAVDALYLKLIDDMARNVCNEMVDADAAESDGTKRQLTRFISTDETADAAAINENLRYLSLRFHARNITDDAGVADLKAVFDATMAEAAEGSSGLEGWRGVCIALIKSPAFHIY